LERWERERETGKWRRNNVLMRESYLGIVVEGSRSGTCVFKIAQIITLNHNKHTNLKTKVERFQSQQSSSGIWAPHRTDMSKKGDDTDTAAGRPGYNRSCKPSRTNQPRARPFSVVAGASLTG